MLLIWLQYQVREAIGCDRSWAASDIRSDLSSSDSNFSCRRLCSWRSNSCTWFDPLVISADCVAIASGRRNWSSVDAVVGSTYGFRI